MEEMPRTASARAARHTQDRRALPGRGPSARPEVTCPAGLKSCTTIIGRAPQRSGLFRQEARAQPGPHWAGHAVSRATSMVGWHERFVSLVYSLTVCWWGIYPLDRGVSATPPCATVGAIDRLRLGPDHPSHESPGGYYGAVSCVGRASSCREGDVTKSLFQLEEQGMIIRSLLVLAFLLSAISHTRAEIITLVNGDFEALPILGAGQTEVSFGAVKLIQTDPNVIGQYGGSISGIPGWTYATPGSGGTQSDHGLARREASFGRPASGQSAFINNWNRMMSQTVQASLSAGTTVTASIDFGTLGTPGDLGRAGRFYLVAGEASTSNPDQFSPRSRILDSLTVANPSWTRFTPTLQVADGVYLPLTLSYTYGPGDPHLDLPLTLAFRTEWFSVGITYWDNAVLSVAAVPEPNSVTLISLALLSVVAIATFNKLRTPANRAVGELLPQS